MRDLLRLLKLWRPAWPWLLGAVLVSLLTTLANLTLMATAGWFVTAMAVAGATGSAINYFTPSSIIRFTAIVRTGGRWLDRVLGHEATFRLLSATRTALFSRLEAIAPAGLDDLRSSEVGARLKLDVDRLELVFLRLIAPLVVALIVGVLVVLVIAWRGDGTLAAAIAAIIVIGALLLPLLLARTSRAAAEREAALASQIQSRTIEHLDGLAALLITGDDRRRSDQLAQLLAERMKAERQVVNRSALAQAMLGIASDAAVMVVLGLGAAAVASARLAGPDLTLLLLLVLSCFEAFAPIPAAAFGFGATASALRRLFALWDRQPLVEDPAHPVALPPGHDLIADHVSFTYPGRSQPALADVNLALPAGSARRLDGASGAGKSTLISLLVRARDLDRGEIRLGGVPIKQLRLADLRSRIALVPQRPHVFAATIADNLRAFAPQASDEQLWQALAKAGLQNAVNNMPDQLATYVGHGGAQLSGGEARRLAIARGLLRDDARILVLDEPTEGLDDASAAAMLSTIASSRGDRSLLLVSHRGGLSPASADDNQKPLVLGDADLAAHHRNQRADQQP
ncbi:ATP-binding cassette subfamily C protein CydC [Rhodopseudomonas faecalis]|uniref:ATP-binding cassette subfamily C protein CydC n=1 Tax=Rhodopseudomonas faecalis TaxID=99655 RepID=A0A318TIJ6_9BRAD|nr:thiol reductant ABC exporter subunit CydC [Rhodopseudomonas faecalis]PYF03630.1 ATP-binding cassette subfamily C protein CydC [Rhodopseudomonas faecalis]